jgi:hypothetical protein
VYFCPRANHHRVWRCLPAHLSTTTICASSSAISASIYRHVAPRLIALDDALGSTGSLTALLSSHQAGPRSGRADKRRTHYSRPPFIITSSSNHHSALLPLIALVWVSPLFVALFVHIHPPRCSPQVIALASLSVLPGRDRDFPSSARWPHALPSPEPLAIPSRAVACPLRFCFRSRGLSDGRIVDGPRFILLRRASAV